MKETSRGKAPEEDEGFSDVCKKEQAAAKDDLFYRDINEQ